MGYDGQVVSKIQRRWKNRIETIDKHMHLLEDVCGFSRSTLKQVLSKTIGLPNPLPPIVCAPDKTTISCTLLSTKYNFRQSLINTTLFMEQWLEGRGIKHKICSNIARSEELRSTKQTKIKNWNSQNIYNLRKRTTHEKPFLLNNVFKEVASNVSSGSLPVGSAVLQKEWCSSENY